MDESNKEKAKKDEISWIAFILLIIGGLNWGLVGLIKLDLVANIFGEGTTLSRIIYLLVGVSAIYMLLMPPKLEKK